MGKTWSRPLRGLVHVVEARLGSYDLARCGTEIIVSRDADMDETEPATCFECIGKVARVA
jgi:hypothetical protein